MDLQLKIAQTGILKSKIKGEELTPPPVQLTPEQKKKELDDYNSLMREKKKMFDNWAEDLGNARQDILQKEFEANQSAAKQYMALVEQTGNEDQEQSKQKFELKQLEIDALLTEEDLYHKKQLEAFKGSAVLIEKENARHQSVMVQQQIAEASAIIGSISSVASEAQGLSDAITQRELKNLDKRFESRLNTGRRLTKAEKEYAKEKDKIEAEALQRQRMYARLQQAIILAQTIANVAAGIASSSTGAPYVKWVEMAAVAASGALQIATIQAQNFQRGYLGDVDRASRADDMPAMIGRNEAVIPAPQYAIHQDDIRAIVNNTANTASGMRSRGGTTIINFVNPTIDQIISAQKSIDRRSRTGTKI